MRRLYSIPFAVALLLAGCQSDATLKSEATNSVSLSLPQTRTSLGEKVGDVYAVLWSEGDRISVNGVESSAATIDATNPSNAQFTLPTSVSYPLNILYPSGQNVTFPAEQSYLEGSYAEGSVPMCGYAASESETIEMRHLAAVLRFPVKAATEGVTLQKIVIKSLENRRLSGLFSVDCQNATIIPTSQSGSSVTYTLPSDFALSTSEESIFYISLPSGETGACTVEFIDGEGGSMVGSWSSKSLRAGVVREFNTITYRSGLSCELPTFKEEEDSFDIPYTTACGYVLDSEGKAISGVAVSDGFSVAKTNGNGYYSLPVTSDTWYIYISVPSEYEVPINSYGQPCFYQRYSSEKNNYNFTLKPMAGGKEEKFALVVLTDLHVSTAYRQARFEREAVPSIRRHIGEIEAQGITCYGLTLGDLISNSGSTDTSVHREPLRSLLAEQSVGMPVFQVMGNHDSTYCDKNNPIYADATSSTFDLKMQRAHEEVFGPANYSFNRGDVHIVGMRDIIYSSNLGNGAYDVGFTDAQLEWLKQDLALVPKDKMVVLGTHIKLQSDYAINHIGEVAALLGEFKEAHVLTGHSHIQRHYPVTSDRPVFEHNLCAISGGGWYCKLCEDGTPNGYNVYVSDGATFSDWYHMAYNKGVDSRSIQMRLYRGNAIAGAKMPSAPGTTDNPDGVKGYYQYNFGENVLLANVYNADTKWVVKVYEDDVYSGDMTLLSHAGYSMSRLIGDGSYENPFRFPDDLETGHDIYTAGLYMGIQSRYKNGEPLGNCWSGNYHMFKYELKNKDAKIRVEAVDRFGNIYTETKITDCTDYTLTSGDYKTDGQ